MNIIVLPMSESLVRTSDKGDNGVLSWTCKPPRQEIAWLVRCVEQGVWSGQTPLAAPEPPASITSNTNVR